MRQSYIAAAAAAAAAAADVRNAASDGFRRLETGSSMTPPWNKGGGMNATRRDVTFNPPPEPSRLPAAFVLARNQRFLRVFNLVA